MKEFWDKTRKFQEFYVYKKYLNRVQVTSKEKTNEEPQTHNNKLLFANIIEPITPVM